MLALLFGVSASAAAAADMSWFLQAGDGDRAVKEATGGVTRQFWSGSGNASRWSVYGEAAIGEWFTHEHPVGLRSHFTHVGLTPVLRYSFDDIVFVEAGVGAQIVAPRFFDSSKRFSSVFQFGDHVAFGMRFGALHANEVSLRGEHFSNGGIRNPNPGQNFIELRYSRHF